MSHDIPRVAPREPKNRRIDKPKSKIPEKTRKSPEGTLAVIATTVPTKMPPTPAPTNEAKITQIDATTDHKVA